MLFRRKCVNLQLNMEKILYVHGFGSSGQSGTVTRIREAMPQATVVAPDLPIHPAEALALLNEVCEREKPDLIIGTSMGGMYTEQLYGYDRILINPAFRMADTMAEHGMMGKQQFQNPRLDGVQEFYVDKPLVKEYRAATERCFARAAEPEEQRHVWGLFGDSDPLVDTIDLFKEHYPTAIRFHGEHRLSDQSFAHAVMPVVHWIDDRQQGRERPVVYISMSALKDAWGKPTSSSQKAVRTLFDTYQLFFVAPATTDDEAYKAVNEWLYEYINVRAYGHTVFTNRKDLLYGDYLIDTEKTDSALATLIQFGSDTFKTWEDILAFFSRLGGQ